MKPLPFARAELDALERRSLRRTPTTVWTRDGVRGRVGTREAVLFCTNDYLGLRCHPRVLEGARRAITAEGAGTGSSRLVAGTLPLHLQLEEALAARFGAPACLVFSSGYHANLALTTALAGTGDLIASDTLNHASLIDGCRLSRARVEVYRHGDPTDLARVLAAPARRRWVFTEGLFSMDGDVPDLAALTRVAAGASAWVAVDEAHAVGVLGDKGGGAAAEAGPAVLDQVSIRVGTLGKALGSHGAFVLCDADTREWLVNRARTFVFTTGLPPASCGAALAALAVLDDERERPATVLARAQRFRRHLGQMGHAPGASRHHVVPVVLGSPERALAAAESLAQDGVHAAAIRPPTVPEGTSRLRFSFSSDHRESEVDQAAEALWDALRRLGAGDASETAA